MHKLSQLISLPVINLYKTKIEGYIEKIYINSETKKVEQFIVYDEEFDTLKSIHPNNIYKIGKDSIFIKNSSKITLFENIEPLHQNSIFPINLKSFNFDGEFLGIVKDAIIDKHTMTSLLINNKNYPTSTIVSMKNNLTIISENKKIHIKKFHPIIKKINSLTEDNTEKEPVVNILKNIQPNKQIANYNFLINRTITKDIKNQHGEIIANKNSIISIKTINKLKFYGKLKELLLFSK